jgi:hypothetical protein
MLARQALYHLSNSSSPFHFNLFLRWGLLPRLASHCDPPTYTSCVARITDVYHHTCLLRWSLTNFLLGWPKTMILPLVPE